MKEIDTEKIRELLEEYDIACKWLKKALSLLKPCEHYIATKGCVVWCVPLDEEMPQYRPCKGYLVCPDYTEKPKPCSTCGGSGFVPENQGHNTIVDIPCPICQALVGESENPHYENWVYHPKDTKKLKDFIKKEKAPTGEVEEFAKKIEEEIKYVAKFNDILWLAKNLKQACTHLTAQAKQIELLQECDDTSTETISKMDEQIAEQYDKGWRDGSDAQDKADHEHIIKPLQAKNEQLEAEAVIIKQSEANQHAKATETFSEAAGAKASLAILRKDFASHVEGAKKLQAKIAQLEESEKWLESRVNCLRERLRALQEKGE